MIEPHGGILVDRTVDASRYEEEIDDWSKITLARDALQDVWNIASGRLSPLKGFLNRSDFLKVVNDMTLEDGTVWPLPVVLDVGPDKAADLNPDEKAALCAPEGNRIGVLDVEEIYRHNKDDAAEAIFGTNDDSHPGVKAFQAKEDFLVGGSIHLFEKHRYGDYDLLPAESRVLFQHYDWDTVVGFQTRNAPHRGHEYIQKTSLEFADGLLVQPKLGEKKAGDYRDDLIIETYRTLIDAYYPPGRVALSVFPSRMRYAGPREAVFDAIVRKNQGCTHFIIGRDHAGVGDFYDGFDAHHIFDGLGDIGITPLFFNYSFFCERCDAMTSEKLCPHDDENRINPSGSKIREKIRSGQQPSAKMMRPEVATYIIDADEPFVK